MKADKKIKDALYKAMDILIEQVSSLSTLVEHIIEDEGAQVSPSSFVDQMEHQIFSIQCGNNAMLKSIQELRTFNNINIDPKNPTDLLFRDAFDFQGIVYNIPTAMINLGNMITNVPGYYTNNDIKVANAELKASVKEAEEQFENVKETLNIIKKELKKKEYEKSVLV